MRRPGKAGSTYARGYTVVEVVMSLAVLTVATVGVVSMMKTSVVGNMRSRNLSAAQGIAQSWQERLRADAIAWTPTQGFNNTKWLGVVGTDFPSVAGNENKWFRPATDAAYFIAPQADVRGFDALAGEPAAFCTNLRLTQIQPNLIRAEVRVFWLAYQGGGNIGAASFCDQNAGYLQNVTETYDPNAKSAGHFHVISLVTTLVRNDQVE